MTYPLALRAEDVTACRVGVIHLKNLGFDVFKVRNANLSGINFNRKLERKFLFENISGIKFYKFNKCFEEK